ncbi:MAG: hypothetical protein GTO24_04970 [candidate division Zixibacteria bacterium]|nr:hypothetical protein [candidate division Zixibacteria bacterium]
MKREAPLFMTVLSMILVFLNGCGGETSRLEYGDLNSLIDSVTVTPTTSGKYSLASGFFKKLAALRQAQGADSAKSVLLTFFSHLHPKIRVTDSLAVLQIVEWIGNCFAQMDSGGVFYTNGAADTYGAWYLQQVEGIRPDLVVISLQFLVGPDYRQFLLDDTDICSALNLSEEDTLPLPPSTSETQDALAEIVTRQVSNPAHPPVYMAPSCGIQREFGEHLVDLGLVCAYQDSAQSQGEILDLLISGLTQRWQLRCASQGSPRDSSYAAQVAWLQYLTLLLRMVPVFEEQKRYQDMDMLFAHLEPVVGEDWRFPAVRYMHCHKSEEECRQYLERVKRYAADHPDDHRVQGALEQLERK